MSSSHPSVTKAGEHIRLLNKCLRRSKRELRWKEESIEVSAHQKSTRWQATAIVDGDPLGSGSGGQLKVAKDQAAREALIKLGIIEGPKCVTV
ncbi:hypothetical protein BS47DRAFT_1336168 [Hydnum rufescens UP504]|uniref:DRBM domain-containing protein n=1 Tax=Hydnum rufescens UP504 TaxID=1448309 RepID=A0A9P6B9F5_9AGAM|nr:hypothetical protein BS47DRAFT_1336168 [Hydnum rufescens UP504]